jgi:glycine hydroxymethyltransferase
VTGQEAEIVLDEIGITLNKNMIADDPRNAMDPSGIRFGTPAMTTRGMNEMEAAQLAEWMIEVLKDKDNTELKAKLRKEVKELCEAHPVPDSFV